MMKILPPPLIIAHRGASQQCPENTMIALERAAAMGTSWVEFDVMLSRDGIPVLMHDSSLSRTTPSHGLTNQKDWAELQTLDAGSWFGAAYAHARIPSLVQVIAWLKQHRIKAVVELKPCHEDDEQTAVQTLKVLQAQWPEFRDHVMVSSFSKSALEAVRALDTEVSLAVSVENWSTVEAQAAQALNASAVHIDFLALTPKLCQSLKQQQLDIFAYTVNDTMVAETLFSWGVTAIFTDVPDVMLSLCQERHHAAP